MATVQPKSMEPFHSISTGWKPTHVAFLLVLILCLHCCKNKYATQLRRVPGPFLAGCTRLWKLHHVRHGQLERVQMKLHARYGPVVRISPNELLISDPSAIKSIYGTANFPKTTFYIPFAAKNHEDLFTDPNIARHAQKRREVAAAYSMNALVELEPFVDKCTNLMCDRLEQLYVLERKPVDLSAWLQFYAFDVIGQITFSRPFGFMKEGKDVQDCIAKLERYVIHAALFTVMPEFWQLYCDSTSILSKLGLVQPPGVTTFTQFTVTQIQGRLERGDEGLPDFVSRLKKMGRGEATIWRSCFANIVAGSDTTAISLRSIFYFLLKHPQAYRRLQKEIDSFIIEGKASDPVTFTEASNMPYLQAVMKEAMRLHPAVQWGLPRYVPDSGLQVGPFNIPSGTEVGVNPYIIHRNTSIFGDDADEFRPERWLEKEKAFEMDRYMIQFGTGSRRCIGQNISLMEMSKLMPQLVRKFEFQLVKPEDDWKVSSYWFAKQTDMDCFVAKR